MRITEIISPGMMIGRPSVLFHATPQRRFERIKIEGLIPSAESHPGRPAGVYLSRDISGAVNYAEMNFGEEHQSSWVILKVDGTALDENKLAADCGHETQMEMAEIIRLGFTKEQVHNWQIPWWVSFTVSGQVLYLGNISPNHFEVIQMLQ